MLWEELTAQEFDSCVEKSEGLCVLPIGVLEKHGNHLPLGTDMYIVRGIAEAAAEASPTVVFPYYYLGQIAEARHVKGTIAASHKLMMDALLEMCDEIHRNGFTKILILSGHGGNSHFLPYFAQMYPGIKRDYALYTHFVHDLTDEDYEEIKKRTETDDLGKHAGFSETALIMHLRPDLVKMDTVDIEESISLGRLDEIKEVRVFTGYNWYADYPNHIAGDPSLATADKGKIIFDMACSKVEKILQVIKNDKNSHKLIEEYNKKAF